jgi:3-methyladenine DNA glycosylase AlkD
MDYTQIVTQLNTLARPDAIAGIQRFGIAPKVEIYGIAVPELQKLAKQIGKNHSLAQQLWTSGIHEGQILATMIDKPAEVTPEQMENWVVSFDSWDVCDQCCGNLFDKTPYAYEKAIEWSAREEEFVKRASFSMMAYLASHDKKASDSKFSQFLPIIQREATDSRNFVKKAVNWALRGIGKRNKALNMLAIKTAHALENSESSAARWVAKDALRELTGDAVQKKWG